MPLKEVGRSFYIICPNLIMYKEISLKTFLNNEVSN